MGWCLVEDTGRSRCVFVANEETEHLGKRQENNQTVEHLVTWQTSVEDLFAGLWLVRQLHEVVGQTTKASVGQQIHDHINEDESVVRSHVAIQLLDKLANDHKRNDEHNSDYSLKYYSVNELKDK
jgi:hypothetical protein